MGRSFRVVLDTNIVVSGVLASGGLEARILAAALHGDILLYASAPILEEYENVLARPKFRLSGPVRSGLIAALKSAATVVVPTRRLLVCSDMDDNIFLECADAAGADYIITGNLRHFPRKWSDTCVVSCRQFLAIVESKRNPPSPNES